MTRKTTKRSTTKPATTTTKPVGYAFGYRTHRVASTTKRGVKKVGSSVAGFFKAVAAGWRAA